MADYPQNVVEFRDWFATESACREYLARLRWPQGLCCPDCASTAVWRRIYVQIDRVDRVWIQRELCSGLTTEGS
jgi:hypothetical protein